MTTHKSRLNFRVLWLHVLLILSLAGCSRPSGRGPGVENTPPPTLSGLHVVLISCDACRPEYFDLAEMPNLEALVQNGVSYRGAWVGAVQNNTPPGHTQMSTGAFPKNNGILGFGWSDGKGGRVNPTSVKAINNGEMAQIVANSGVPTLAGLFKAQDGDNIVAVVATHKIYAAQGLGVGPADYILYTEKVKKAGAKATQPADPIEGYEPPGKGTLRPAAIRGHEPEQSFLDNPALQAALEQPGDDARYAFHLASSVFSAYRPRLLMINVSEPDGWGHKTGGLTDPENMGKVMLGVDDGLGELLQTYRQAGIFEQTLWVFTADHGMTPAYETYYNEDVRQTVTLPGGRGRASIPLTYLKDPALASQVADQLQAANLPGVVGVYYRTRSGSGYSYQATAGSASSLPAGLNQAYLYLLDTFACQGSPDVVTTTREGVLYESVDKQRLGAHGEINWVNQHIPLIFSGPGIQGGVVSDFPARLVDIAPTIARLSGMPAAGMDGVVLSDAMLAPEAQDVQVQSETGGWLARRRDALRSFAGEQGAVSTLGTPRPAKPLSTTTPGSAAAGSWGNLRFEQDYFPGSEDAAGLWMGGTETMDIFPYQGKLFATMGFWMDDPYGEDSQIRPWNGAQILVKDAADAPWRVEVNFGPTYLRVEAIRALSFSTDWQGGLFEAPVTMLIASPNDINIEQQRVATAWTRDDQSEKWEKSTIAQVPRQAVARSFGAHIDAVTGIHHVFAGVSYGQIQRGAYDPAAPGRLRWEAEAELTGTGRVMAFAECNGVLYAATGLEKRGKTITGGLFRRIDGEQPRWELVYQYPYNDSDKGEANLMRGLTAIPDPNGSGRQVLLATRANPGVIERIDPHHNHAVTVELDIREHFQQAWGLEKYKGAALSAYNRFLPAVHPITGEAVHLVSLWVTHPERKPPHNNAFFLVRHADATYEHVEIYDPAHPAPAGDSLRATRAMAISPFPEDGGQVYYFGGYDCAGKVSHNTAWIYRGAWITP